MTISLFVEATGMLHYLGSGERRYHIKPLAPCERKAWEFQAVIDGQIAPLFPGRSPQLQASTLWVFTPSCRHGWDGEHGGVAEVCVFQFASVPAQLQDAFGAREYFSVQLDDLDCLFLRERAQEARAEMLQPSSMTLLRHQRLLLDLTLLVLGKIDGAEKQTDTVPITPRRQVDAAMTWFRGHLSEAPTQVDVAEAINCSPAHLRRLFHRVLGASPRDVLEQIRFQVACELLSDTTLSLDAVALQCGLGSASAFSRAFSKRLLIAPSEWRAAQEQAYMNDGDGRQPVI